jgi:hypothetical protein
MYDPKGNRDEDHETDKRNNSELCRYQSLSTKKEEYEELYIGCARTL